jgi:haloacid dehalogenase-like hydrolase
LPICCSGARWRREEGEQRIGWLAGVPMLGLDALSSAAWTVMITGDNPLTAASIAAEAGVDDFLAEATPEHKMQLIRREQQDGKLVAMTGDGTNDAPALAQADVGVAMNTGTQAAKEAGNMVDLDSSPTKLIDIVAWLLSRTSVGDRNGLRCDRVGWDEPRADEQETRRRGDGRGGGRAPGQSGSAGAGRSGDQFGVGARPAHQPRRRAVPSAARRARARCCRGRRARARRGARRRTSVQILGEPRVNVLQINLALDERWPLNK